MAEARLLGGTPINWNRPPKATTRVEWSKRDAQGRRVTGSLRTICHLNMLNNLAKRKYGAEIVVLQPPYNTTVSASAGTHDYDACIDLYIPGVSWWEQQRFLRVNGFACWYRHPPAFGNHIHGFTLPLQEGVDRSDDFKTAVGIYVDGGYSLYGRRRTSSQIEDYYNRAFGLSGQHGRGSDRSWYPPVIKATIFDLAAYISRRAWKPTATKAISLSAAQKQFRIAVGVEKGKVARSNDIGLIQKALNTVAGETLAVDGVCGIQTANAWGRWEGRASVPGSDRPRVPDDKSLAPLAKRAGYKTTT